MVGFVPIALTVTLVPSMADTLIMPSIIAWTCASVIPPCAPMTALTGTLESVTVCVHGPSPDQPDAGRLSS